MAPVLRIFIGLIFLASGVEKLLSPYQNFLYVIQTYEFLPSILEKVAAISVPWVELIVGLFLVLGLFTNLSLKIALILFGCFIVIVGQALLRGLPIDQCGCFGESIHIPPNFIIIFDSMMVFCSIYLIKNISKAKMHSLDKKTLS